MLIRNALSKYDIHPKGVVHVGASLGQETPIYLQAGVKEIVYIEAIGSVYEQLREIQSQYQSQCNIQCINACITNRDGDNIKFNVSSNDGQSSSIFEFGTHAAVHPQVKFIDKIEITSSRIDTLFKQHTLDPSSYDFLNMDLQGAELLALISMGDLLENFKWAYIEVNKEELYVGCAKVDQIDYTLAKVGLVEIETKWTDCGWGDRLYGRRN